MGRVILDIKNLDKTYVSDGIENPVIRKMNLQIYAGDFTVVMGPSGSGKSTLLYCLGAMEDVTGGSILFQGKDITKMKENALSDLRLKKFGFIFQQIHLVSNLSLFENVILPGMVWPKNTKEDVNKRALELLERFRVKDVSERLPSQVSGGEQQRAAIARSLINRPDVLFADEPTGALNQNNSEIVMDLFSELNRDGQSILLVTHDRRAALRGNRIIYIIDGAIRSELELEPYDPANLQEREEAVNSWLASLGW
ncbi:MAG: ABC transporter ATP-binding protein [Clostridiaceae bacterium]|nr:ABC transporter ATP-binding protein [Clostridiaceae bacterium]